MVSGLAVRRATHESHGIDRADFFRHFAETEKLAA
jgi:hypothetical protein